MVLAPVNSFIPPISPVIVWSIEGLSGAHCRIESPEIPLYNAPTIDSPDKFELLFVEEHVFKQCQHFPAPEQDLIYPVLVKRHNGRNALLSPVFNGWVLVHLQDDPNYDAGESRVVSHHEMLSFLLQEAESWEMLTAEAEFTKPVPKGVLK